MWIELVSDPSRRSVLDIKPWVVTPLVAAVLLAAGSSVSLAPPAGADSSGTWIPYGLTDRCVSEYFQYGPRGTTRYLCDGPLRDDGSWERCRNFYSPEKYWESWNTDDDGNPVSSYSLPMLNIYECYTVTPDTVLPDEPGWIDPPSDRIPLGSCQAQKFAVNPVPFCF
jgi:hypothetical protein